MIPAGLRDLCLWGMLFQIATGFSSLNCSRVFGD